MSARVRRSGRADNPVGRDFRVPEVWAKGYPLVLDLYEATGSLGKNPTS
jgi:hypothetical protein